MYASAQVSNEIDLAVAITGPALLSPCVQRIDTLALQMVRLTDRLPRLGETDAPHRTQAHLAAHPAIMQRQDQLARAGF
jgi:hypothetical protein